MTQTSTSDAVFRPVLVLMSGRILGFVAAFIIPVVLARLLDQHDFGTYKQLFLVHATLFGLAQLGMAESLYYFLPMEARRSGAYILNALLMMGVAGSVVGGLLWWQRDTVALLLNNPELSHYLPYISIYLMFILLGLVLEIVLTVRRQHIGASVSYAGTDLARALLLIVPMLVIADLGILMSAAVVFAVCRLAVTMVYLQRAGGILLRTDRVFLRRHLSYALPFGLAGFIEVLQLNAHLYAVSYYFDAATFAIYAVGCLQVPLIDILMTSTSNVMMVSMRHKLSDQDMEGVVAVWLDATRKLAIILFPLIALLLLSAPLLIILLFGTAYQSSVPVFMVWTASSMLLCLLTDGVLRVFAQNRFLIIQNIVRLVIVLLLIQVLLSSMGLIGAVLATTIAAAIVKIIALKRVSVLMQLPLRTLLPWRDMGSVLLLCIAASVPSAFLLWYLPISGLFALILIGAVFTLCYGVLLIGTGPLRREEKIQLLAWILAPLQSYRTTQ